MHVVVEGWRDQTKFYTRGHLLKHGVVNAKQGDKLNDAIREVKKRVKYLNNTELQQTNVLYDLMVSTGIEEPKWDPLDVKKSLDWVRCWTSKVIPMGNVKSMLDGDKEYQKAVAYETPSERPRRKKKSPWSQRVDHKQHYYRHLFFW